MSFKKADKVLIEIIECRIELNQLSYNDPKYDEVEDRLHTLEDTFEEEFGELLEEVIEKIHDQYCPDDDVLSPISYIAGDYKQIGEKFYECDYKQGVPVEMSKLPGKPAKLVFLPNPIRLVMNVDGKHQYEVWSSDGKK